MRAASRFWHHAFPPSVGKHSSIIVETSLRCPDGFRHLHMGVLPRSRSAGGLRRCICDSPTKSTMLDGYAGLLDNAELGLRSKEIRLGVGGLCGMHRWSFSNTISPFCGESLRGHSSGLQHSIKDSSVNTAALFSPRSESSFMPY